MTNRFIFNENTLLPTSIKQIAKKCDCVNIQLDVFRNC